MKFIIKKSAAIDIEDVVTWEYEPPYHIYNSNEDFNSIDEATAYFLDPDYAFHTIFEKESGELVGICSFGNDGRVPGGDYSADALDIGMGIKPSWTGQGHGFEYVQAVIAFAEETFHPTMLRVTIAAFNLRAQRVWQKAGFAEVSRFDARHSKRPFIIYTRNIN